MRAGRGSEGGADIPVCPLIVRLSRLRSLKGNLHCNWNTLSYADVETAPSWCAPGRGFHGFGLLDVRRQECLLHPEICVLTITCWIHGGITHSEAAEDASLSSGTFEYRHVFCIR